MIGERAKTFKALNDGLGIFLADLPTQSMPAGGPIKFTR